MTLLLVSIAVILLIICWLFWPSSKNEPEATCKKPHDADEVIKNAAYYRKEYEDALGFANNDTEALRKWCNRFKISDPYLMKEHGVALSKKFGTNAPVNDVIWSIFCSRFLSVAPTSSKELPKWIDAQLTQAKLLTFEKRYKQALMQSAEATFLSCQPEILPISKRPANELSPKLAFEPIDPIDDYHNGYRTRPPWDQYLSTAFTSGMKVEDIKAIFLENATTGITQSVYQDHPTPHSPAQVWDNIEIELQEIIASNYKPKPSRIKPPKIIWSDPDLSSSDS